MKLKLEKPLEDIKNMAKKAIDEQAEKVRLKFITPGDGQAMVYIAKEGEAKAYLANQDINHTLIPHVVTEAINNNSTLEDAANLIMTKANGWREVSSSIEDKRMQAKKAVDEATTTSEIAAAQNIVWF